MRAGRLDFILRFPMPDRSDRIEIFRVHTLNRPLAPEVDLLELADLTEGMAGSQIAFLCNRATLIGIAEIIHDPARHGEGQLRVTAQHFKTAIGEARKTEEIPKC
jgi:transitional endoplasmic reticulum ATPase